MPVETEKKFKVRESSILRGRVGVLVDQGYFSGKTLIIRMAWREGTPRLVLVGRRVGVTVRTSVRIPRRDAAQLALHWTGQAGRLLHGRLTLRGRLMGKQGFLTIKSNTKGISRAEFEYEMPRKMVAFLLDRFATEGRLTKLRYLLPVEHVVFEVDRFLGRLAGGIVAEVELPDEKARVPAPSWLGAEVTDDPRLRNSALAVADRFPDL